MGLPHKDRIPATWHRADLSCTLFSSSKRRPSKECAENTDTFNLDNEIIHSDERIKDGQRDKSSNSGDILSHENIRPQR